jgi:hypothetical protein
VSSTSTIKAVAVAAGVPSAAASATYTLPAGKLVFRTQPTTGLAGSPLTPNPSVAIETLNGVVNTAANGPVTVQIGSNPGGGTLSGSITINAVKGIATFPGLAVTTQGDGYTLTALATGDSSVTSNPFNLTNSVTLSLAATAPSVGTTATANFALKAPAPQGGLVATLQSSNAAVATVNPASITIPEGETKGSFEYKAAAPGSAILTVNVPGAPAASATVSFAPAVSVSLSPANVTLSQSQTQAFTASVANSSNTAVTWSLIPAVGTISATGVYSAPSTISAAQIVTVTATSAGDSTKSATATISLTPPVSVTLTPASVTLGQSQTQVFAASDANTSNTAVTWTISPAIGSISASGLYTAPASISATQTVTVKATSVADPTKAATATISLTPPVSVSLTPASVTLGQSQTQAFTASVANSLNTAVTWSINPAVGTISATGIYSAPSTISVAQTVTVKATSVADPTKAMMATVSLLPLPAPVFSPAPGTYTTPQSVKLSDTAAGARIYYTLDGSLPSTSSMLYSVPINISNTTNVQAIAVANGVSSPLVGASYAIGSKATKLAFVTQPSDASVGAAIAPGIVVIAEDASGNPAAMPPVPVTLSFAVNPGKGTLTGIVSETPSSASAVFTNLSINSAGVGYRLTASAPGLTDAVSTNFTIGTSGTSSSMGSTGEQPASAMKFTNSVGINVHLDFSNTLYTNNFPLILASLKDLRIQHVRDGLADWGTGPAAYYTAHKTLAANGIYADFITTIKQSASLIQAYPARVGDMEAIEAPNEYDTSGDPNWAADLRAYLPVIQNAVQSSSTMAGITVFGPSLVNQNWYSANNSYARLGPVSGSFGQGNLHNYPGGRNPGTAGWTPQGYGSIAFAISTAKTEWPTSPLVSTEDGYWDTPTMTESDPDSVIAKYTPRLLLEQYLHGITRTYVYELADNQFSGGSYGLLQSNGTPKPQYVALRSMMQMLSDPGTSYSTNKLAYAFSNSASDVHHLLLQKRDGTYLLAIWVEEPCYDVNAKAALAVPSRSISINFAKAPVVQSVYQWQPDGTTATTASGVQSSSLPITISDQLTIVEFTMPQGS